MILSARAIESAVEAGRLGITPFAPDRLRPASYIVHLGSRFRRWRAGRAIQLWRPVDAADLGPIEEVSSFTLEPNAFVLAQTIESMSLPGSLAAQLSPLSHIARFGLSVHCGADWVNPGFGQAEATPLTLELVNHNPSPLVLDAGIPICHLRLIEIDSLGELSATSVYEGRDPLGPPRFFEEMSQKTRPSPRFEV